MRLEACRSVPVEFIWEIPDEIDRSDGEQDDPNLYCLIEADAKNHASSSYLLSIECAYPECNEP